MSAFSDDWIGEWFPAQQARERDFFFWIHFFNLLCLFRCKFIELPTGQVVTAIMQEFT
jgi:hypothetical protein